MLEIKYLGVSIEMIHARLHATSLSPSLSLSLCVWESVCPYMNMCVCHIVFVGLILN